MSLLSGTILLPANAPRGIATVMRIEIRDVSRLDAPSVLIAQQRSEDISLTPNESIPFQITLPAGNEHSILSLRVHISLNGDFQPQPGDLLTTRSYPINAVTASRPLQVTLQVI